MKIYITQAFSKQLANYRNQSLYSNYLELIDFLHEVDHCDDLVIRKAFGFKKYKGIQNNKVYGFDINKQQGGERLISKIIEPSTKLFLDLKLSERETALLFHRIVKHDDQSYAAQQEAKKDYDQTQILPLPKDIDEDLSKDLEGKGLYREVRDKGRSIAVLTNDKREILSNFLGDTPIIVNGIAGSGKTEITIGVIETLNSLNPKSKTLYLTFNDKLLEMVREGSNCQNSSFEYHTLKSLFRMISSNSSMQFASELTFKRFLGQSFSRDHRYLKNVQKLEDRVSQERIYAEMYGLILGSLPSVSEVKLALSKEQYLEHAKTHSLIENQEDRKLVYQLSQHYIEYLKKHALSDYNIETIRLAEKHLCVPTYDYVVIDEVQDLTERQFAFVYNLLKDKRHLFITGDPNQTISPTRFDIGKIRQLPYLHGIATAKVERLLGNYRNSQAVTELINALNEIRDNRLVKQKIELVQKEVSKGVSTGKTYLFEGGIGQLDQVLIGANTVIITVQNQVKHICDLLKTQLVFSVDEIKGLEFDNVILIDLLSDNKSIIDSIFAPTKNKDQSLHYYFNMFYVGVSRACKNLVIYESKSTPLLEELKKKLTTTTLVCTHTLTPIDLEVDTSAEGYFQLGVKLKENGNYEKAFEAYLKCMDLNEGYDGLYQEIKICEIYIKYQNDVDRAKKFSEGEHFREAKKVYFQLNDHTQVARMCLHLEQMSEFEETIKKHRIDLFDFFGLSEKTDYLLDSYLDPIISESQVVLNQIRRAKQTMEVIAL